MITKFLHLLHIHTLAQVHTHPHTPKFSKAEAETEHIRLGKDINTGIWGFLKSLADFSWTMLLTKGFISGSLGESAYLKVFI